LARDIAPANTEQLFSNETVAAIELLGPALPAVNKIEDVFRVQFLIKATNQSALRSYAERILPVLQHYRRNFKVQLVLDLEPREMI
jgi:primosomal protein N'